MKRPGSGVVSFGDAVITPAGDVLNGFPASIVAEMGAS